MFCDHPSLPEEMKTEKLLKEASKNYDEFQKIFEEYFGRGLDKKCSKKMNKKRIKHKIIEYNETKGPNGFCYLYDLLRASCRFDEKDELVSAL